MNPKRILIACEFSGRVRDAFIAKGHNAVSCDLVPSSTRSKLRSTTYLGVAAAMAEQWG